MYNRTVNADEKFLLNLSEWTCNTENIYSLCIINWSISMDKISWLHCTLKQEQKWMHQNCQGFVQVLIIILDMAYHTARVQMNW